MKKTKLSKKIIIAITLSAIVLLAYTLGWLETYFLAEKYMEKALNNYESGEFLKAIDGYEHYDEQKGEYTYWAGFVQISTMFSSSFSFPKSSISSDAHKMGLKTIIKLNDKELMSYFKKTMRQNNPLILYVCSELYHRIPKNADYFSTVFEKLGGNKENIEKYYLELHEFKQ